jgi:hypothetical protein
MKQYMAKLAMAIAVIGLAAAPAVAAEMQSQVKAEIPFAFMAGEKAMPAGTYTVFHSGSNGVITLRAIDGKSAAMVQVNPVYRKDGDMRAELWFNKYGERYFLSRVNHPTWAYNQEVRKTKTEREYVAQAPGAPKLVAVAAK